MTTPIDNLRLTLTPGDGGEPVTFPGLFGTLMAPFVWAHGEGSNTWQARVFEATAGIVEAEGYNFDLPDQLRELARLLREGKL